MTVKQLSTLFRVYPALRPYRARVLKKVRLSPSFVRIIFTGELFHLFSTDGLDQRIKILFPLPGRSAPDLGQDDDWAEGSFTWYQRWRELPAENQLPVRTYTLRSADQEAGTVTVDFVVHGTSGPGSTFASNCLVEDEVIIVGPDRRSVEYGIGVGYQPGCASTILIAGDETAVPAACALLEQHETMGNLHALLEVPTASDELTTPGALWLPRGAAGGSPLVEAVSKWVTRNLADVQSPDFYAWLAGEAGTVKALRKMLVTDLGIDRTRVSFMGYWRQGRSGV